MGGGPHQLLTVSNGRLWHVWCCIFILWYHSVSYLSL